MKLALFVPCYIDQFYPQVAIASLQLLRHLGMDVHYPPDQTCCGQPMANSGFEKEAIATAQHMVEQFADYDYIVGPSGSCVYHMRHHYDILPQSEAVVAIRERSFELCQFITEVLQVEEVGARFAERVALHQSCHGLRGLRQGRSSERMVADYSLQKRLLQNVSGLELVDLQRQDECCGFGGTFAVSEAAVSVRMGQDRLGDHQSANVEIVTGGDMSCLMHLQGIAKREERPLRFMHIAEILNQRG
ncbi:MAG: (Fe-S)-binding protein [Bacteroidota bacterium]